MNHQFYFSFSMILFLQLSTHQFILRCLISSSVYLIHFHRHSVFLSVFDDMRLDQHQLSLFHFYRSIRTYISHYTDSINIFRLANNFPAWKTVTQQSVPHCLVNILSISPKKLPFHRKKKSQTKLHFSIEEYSGDIQHPLHCCITIASRCYTSAQTLLSTLKCHFHRIDSID